MTIRYDESCHQDRVDKEDQQTRKERKEGMEEKISETGRSEASRSTRRSTKQKSEKSFSTVTGEEGTVLLVEPEPYQFVDPCPPCMRHVRISDLSAVDINWKMLTLARPSTITDENIFSK